MWPQSILSSKQKTKKHYPNITDEECFAFKNRMHNITNLQLLVQADNSAKGDTLFEQWVSGKFTGASLHQYQEDACIDPDAPITFASFIEFTDKRSEVLRRRLREEFPDDIESRLFPNG